MAVDPYHDKRWPKLAKRIIARDGGRCQIGNPGCTKTATECDHITSWRLGAKYWFDPDNLRAACRRCNRGNYNRVTLELGTRADLPAHATVPAEAVIIVERSKGKVWALYDGELAEITREMVPAKRDDY